MSLFPPRVLSAVRMVFPPQALFCALVLGNAEAEDAVFYRGINVNGPPVTISGRAWEGKGTANFTATGTPFENQAVALRPPADRERAAMIRSSNYGPEVDLTLSRVPPGKYQIFLYVWEDNQSEQFRLLVNDRVMLGEFHSGATGAWKKLGPWLCESVEDRIKVSARGPDYGAANLSGLEVWAGDGPVPPEPPPVFADSPTPEQIAFFESRVRPVLVENCYECHSAQAGKSKGGLYLDSREGVRRGGGTGPAVSPWDPDASLLIQAVRHVSEDLSMPPEKKLPPESIAALEEWVRMGAPDPRNESAPAAAAAKPAIDWNKAREWWSFHPLTDPAPPAVRDTAWPANGLDSFILAKLEAEGLAPAPDAPPRVLIRRLTYDLTGLPPSVAELEAFEKAASENLAAAWGDAVERLLASPAYGERWGRHWLDVVRYADTAGDNSDFPVPQMSQYRDWVISALNRDLPYDEFVREQLAGDLLPGRTNDQLVATGYLANSRRFGSRVDDYPQHLTIEDTIDNFGRAFLGLTINCARCHDHKFDPISAADYYALYGIFRSTRYPWPGIELEQRQRDLVPMVPPDQAEAALTEIRARGEELDRLKKEAKRLEEELGKAGDEEAKGEIRRKQEDAGKALEEWAAKPSPPLAYAVAEGPDPGDAPIQLRGDPSKPGQVTRRHFLTILGGAELPPEETGSGRRQLAEWVLDPANPLPARVMVNRLWQGHFGKGLVRTPNDFGKQGQPPSHPELLDWLASRFKAGGWSMKDMHRLIVSSRTYRQAGNTDPKAAEKDPSGSMLSGFPRHRLEAEAIRDTLLVLGGSLDRSPAGGHPFPPQEEWNFTQHNPFKAVYPSDRRSVYLMTQRIQRHPFLAIFDGADPSASTPRRATSTTPLQALFLLNDPLVHEQAARFADRVRGASPDDPARITAAWRELFSRPPQDEETQRSLAYLAAARETLSRGGCAAEDLKTEAWRTLVRALLRLNEFFYPD